MPVVTGKVIPAGESVVQRDRLHIDAHDLPLDLRFAEGMLRLAEFDLFEKSHWPDPKRGLTVLNDGRP